jgi:hypothetical protein
VPKKLEPTGIDDPAIIRVPVNESSEAISEKDI